MGPILDRRVLLGAALAAGVAGHARAAASLTVKDDQGRDVTVAFPVKRAVIFNRYDLEFVRAVAGIGVVAGIDGEVAKAKAYWPGLEKTPVAGEGQSDLNYEQIVALKPDVVLIPRNGDWARAAQVLPPFHIPVVVLTGWDVLKHEENVTLLGRIFDQPARAAALNVFYRHTRDLLTARLKGVVKKRVYMEEVKDYSTLLKGSGWHDMIETGGGINVFGDVNVLALPSGRGNIQGFQVDPEEILVRRPDVIIKLQPNQYEPHTREFSAGVLNAIAARPGFAGLAAVQSGQVYDMSYYLAGGCSKIIGALQVAKWLYPERFGDVDPADAMRVWLEKFQGVAYPGGYWMSLAQLRK